MMMWRDMDRAGLAKLLAKLGAARRVTKAPERKRADREGVAEQRPGRKPSA